MERDNKLDLKNKYRPKDFSELIGCEAVITSLKSVLQRKEGIPHSFLFVGPKGCGKSSLMELVVKELNCPKYGVTIHNIADTRGIDDARAILDGLSYAPLIGNIKIIVLEECHMATTPFQNALLLKLEKPPSYAFFILCSTEPEKIIGTVKDRCHIYTVNKLTKMQIMKLLKWVCKEEKVTIPDALLKKIIECCDGTPRKALELLDKIIDIDDDEIASQLILDDSVDEKSVLDLCKALLGFKSWSEIAIIIRSIKDEPEKVRHAVGGYMAAVLLNSENVVAIIALDILETTNFMYSGKWGMTSAFYKIFHSTKK